MFSQKDVIDLWNRTDMSDFEKRMYLVCMVSEMAKKANIECVLVGGAATELYTQASYATSDIDMIVAGDLSERKAMEQLGFQKEGRSWFCDETAFNVEFPRGPLDGDWKRIKKIETEIGELFVIGIEDMIVDRCARVSSWSNNEDYDVSDENAWESTDEVVYFLLSANADSIDWEYLNKKAKEVGCEQTLRHYKKHFNKLKGDIDERNPKQIKIQQTDAYKTYLQSIKDYPQQQPSPPVSAMKKLFMEFACKVLKENSQWDKSSDLQVFQEMEQAKIPAYQIKKAMLYSPSCFNLNNLKKTLKFREIHCEYMKKMGKDSSSFSR